MKDAGRAGEETKIELEPLFEVPWERAGKSCTPAWAGIVAEKEYVRIGSK